MIFDIFDITFYENYTPVTVAISMEQSKYVYKTTSQKWSSLFLTGAELFLCLMSCSVASGARVLIYTHSHCFNSHLLNGERMGEILAKGGHHVDMLISSTYKGYDQLLDDNYKVSGGFMEGFKEGFMHIFILNK